MIDLDNRKGLAHLWWGLTALAAIIGIVTSAITAYRNDAGFFDGPWERFFNTFAFFTVQSNTLIAISSALLFLNAERASTLFRTVWLTALVAISITGVIYHWLLAGADDLQGLALFANLLVHTVVPIMAVIAFFVFGPRGLATGRIARLTLVFIALWATFTVVRGEIVEWYPYPFIDVNDKGYPRVIVNALGIGVLYVAVGYGYALLDRLLTSDEAAVPHPAA